MVDGSDEIKMVLLAFLDIYSRSRLLL